MGKFILIHSQVVTHGIQCLLRLFRHLGLSVQRPMHDFLRICRGRQSRVLRDPFVSIGPRLAGRSWPTSFYQLHRLHIVL